MQYLSFLTKSIKNNPAIIAILLLGFLLRIISTTPGYYYPIGDELLYSQAIYMLINRTLSLELPWLGFPPLIPWIMLPAFTFIFIPIRLLVILFSPTNSLYNYLPFVAFPFLLFLLLIKKIFHLQKKKFMITSLVLFWLTVIITAVVGLSVSPIFQRAMLGLNWTIALYWGRYVTAIIGTLVILFTYLVAMIYFDNKPIALLSAFFVSINYRMVLSSHIGLPDMYNVLFLLVALYAIGKLLKNNSFRGYLWAMLAMASFFMIKYQTHIALPFLATHIMISLKATKRSLTNFLRNFFTKKVFIAGFISLAFVLAAHFYHFRNWDKVLEINNYQAIKYGFGRNILDLYPIAYLYHTGIGAALSIISILGIIFSLINKKYGLSSIILISVLPTFIYLYLYYTNGGIYTRNVIATIPIFLIFSAILVCEAYSVLLKTFRKSKTLIATFLIILIALLTKDNFINSIITAKAYSQEAPRVLAQKWIDKNVNPGNVFGSFLGAPWPKDENVQSINALPFYKEFSYQEVKNKYDIYSIEMSHLRDQFAWWTRQVPQIQKAFWDKPNDLLSQNYYSLAFREHIWRGGQALFLSPWQAPSHNVAIVKITKNEFENTKFKQLAKYSDFSKNWTRLYFSPNYKDLPTDVLDVSSNSLIIKSGRMLPGSVRHESKKFDIKAGYAYKIIAKTKNDQPIPIDERDGFIRLDFYESEPTQNILSRPQISFVSERVYGTSEIHTIEITAIAPQSAKFAKLGFQADGTARAILQLTDIEISESESQVSDSSMHFTIPDDELFLPNNDGVL